MATTTLLQRHAGEGETIAEAIRDCLDYGKDPEKTESGKYISAYECDPATVADEFLLAKASYAAMTGREQKKENNVLCYQIRQSFYPGEITPKEANRIGYELAMRWTKGRHAFIVTTHTDKQHIHCHIYYNSTTLDCTRKFRNFWGSSFALRRLSDRLCLENGLSIVENPKPRSKGKYRNYGEWQKDRKGPLSYQDRLRLAIDTALAERPADLDEFLNLMKRAGYEVKTVRGGGISFRLTGQGQERFTRLRASTLGDGYDLQDVLSAIEGKEKRLGRSERKISLAVDIQAKLAAGEGPGYGRWAKGFNIKQNHAGESGAVIRVLRVAGRQFKLQHAACGNLDAGKGHRKAVPILGKFLAAEIGIAHFGQHKIQRFVGGHGGGGCGVSIHHRHRKILLYVGQHQAAALLMAPLLAGLLRGVLPSGSFFEPGGNGWAHPVRIARCWFQFIILHLLFGQRLCVGQFAPCHM